MTRTLTELSDREREYVISTVHGEAEASGWSQLSNLRKSALYSAWESQFNLTHATLKDGIMKGFDAAQGIPKKAEAEKLSRQNTENLKLKEVLTKHTVIKKQGSCSCC